MLKKLEHGFSLEKLNFNNQEHCIFIKQLSKDPLIKKWIGTFSFDDILDQHKKGYYYFIVKKERNKIGFIGVDIYNLDGKVQATLLYMIESSYRGKNYGFNLLKELTNYCINLGIEQINLYIEEKNEQSKKIAFGNGYFKQEGKRYIKQKEIVKRS